VHRTITLGAIGVLAAASMAPAQPLNRLKGRVVSERGEAIEADVRIEAVSGPRGDDYVGQRTYTVRSNARGEWTLIGFKAGAWMFWTLTSRRSTQSSPRTQSEPTLRAQRFLC
jgi:hypothetical protein